jgi:hypothetical protein
MIPNICLIFSDNCCDYFKNVAATPLGVLYVHHYSALTHTATKILALRAFFEHFTPVSTPYSNL